MRYFYTVYRVNNPASVGMVLVTKPSDDPYKDFPFWVWILIGASVMLIIVMVFVLLCSRRKNDPRFYSAGNDGMTADGLSPVADADARRISIGLVDTESRTSSFARDPERRYGSQNSRTWLSQVKNADKRHAVNEAHYQAEREQ